MKVVAEHLHEWLDGDQRFTMFVSDTLTTSINQGLDIVKRWKIEHGGKLPGFEQSGLMAIELLPWKLSHNLTHGLNELIR